MCHPDLQLGFVINGAWLQTTRFKGNPAFLVPDCSSTFNFGSSVREITLGVFAACIFDLGIWCEYIFVCSKEFQSAFASLIWLEKWSSFYLGLRLFNLLTSPCFAPQCIPYEPNFNLFPSFFAIKR